MSEKIREEFESWLLENTGFDTQRTAFAMTKQEDQQYMCHRTNLAWLAWQASRSALVVELPEMAAGGDGYMYEDAYACGQHDCLAEVKSLLEASGVSYK